MHMLADKGERTPTGEDTILGVYRGSLVQRFLPHYPGSLHESMGRTAEKVLYLTTADLDNSSILACYALGKGDPHDSSASEMLGRVSLARHREGWIGKLEGATRGFDERCYTSLFPLAYETYERKSGVYGKVGLSLLGVSWAKPGKPYSGDFFCIINTSNACLLVVGDGATPVVDPNEAEFIRTSALCSENYANGVSPVDHFWASALQCYYLACPTMPMQTQLFFGDREEELLKKAKSIYGNILVPYEDKLRDGLKAADVIEDMNDFLFHFYRIYFGEESVRQSNVEFLPSGVVGVVIIYENNNVSWASTGDIGIFCGYRNKRGQIVATRQNWDTVGHHDLALSSVGGRADEQYSKLAVRTRISETGNLNGVSRPRIQSGEIEDWYDRYGSGRFIVMNTDGNRLRWVPNHFWMSRRMGCSDREGCGAGLFSISPWLYQLDLMDVQRRYREMLSRAQKRRRPWEFTSDEVSALRTFNNEGWRADDNTALIVRATGTI